MVAALAATMKLSISSLGPTAFAREIASPTGRFSAVLVDLDEDDIPTMIGQRPLPRTTAVRLPLPLAFSPA